MSDKKDKGRGEIERSKKRRGAPPPKGRDARMHSGTVCTATRRDGSQCTNFAINGATVCRMHGGSAPQVRRAAQVRLLMASDLAAKKLIEMIMSSKDERVVLAAVRDLLDRANLAGTQNIEVGVTKRTFEDFIGDAIIDVEEDDEEFDPLPAIPDDIIEDAEVVDDEPLMNRHDRALAAEVARTRSRAPRPGDMSNEQRAQAEAVLLAEQRHAEHLEHQAKIDRDRAAMLLAKMNGTYNPSTRGEAMREAAEQAGGKRRARNARAKFGDS